VTLLTLSMPWPTLGILFPLSLGLFNVMAILVRINLVISGHRNGGSSPVRPAIVWLYAAAVSVMLLAPAPAMLRLLSFFLSLFLFRMTLTDALTGLLPREMTVSCLTAGLAAALLHPGFTEHLLSAVIAMLIFGGWRYGSTKIQGRECLGLGDVWLAGAIAAWLGGASGLYALLTGVMFFVLWQLTVRRIREGGPMGPWLCAGAMSVTLLKLYQPLITW
jgi:prepilin signal peptidase PulO-like enzyme (type II secretory pathway)